MSSIICRDVAITYPSLQAPGGEFVAVRDFDLEVDEGEFVTMVGASGCGKTTLLYAIDGLVPVASGTIEVDGVPVTGPGRDRAVVFQEFGLLPWRSVVQNIALGLEAQRMARGERVEIARRLADQVGLGAFHDARPNELSGGMRQRVGIARALAVDPKILLMDEPFGALDAQTRDIMGEELLHIWAKTRKTVLFITHDIDEAVYLADEVVVLSARPGTVREVVEVDLPRPRSLDVRSSAAFGSYRSHVWHLLEEEVRRTAGAGA